MLIGTSKIVTTDVDNYLCCCFITDTYCTLGYRGASFQFLVRTCKHLHDKLLLNEIPVYK